MKILAVDTALGACSVAVMDGGRVLAHTHEDMPRGHAEALAPMTQAAMQRARLAFAELERLAVTTGPGTFTGQRVGLAFVRAMALALKIPAVGVTTLDAMAEEALAHSKAPWALAAADAKRNEVYLGARSRTEVLLAPMLMDVARAAEAAREHVLKAGLEFVLAGTGAPLLFSLLEGIGHPALGPVRQPDAVFVARLGAAVIPTGAPPRPLYLRAPDAKLPAKGMSAIRPATLADAPLLASLHARSFAQAWDSDSFARLLNGGGIGFIALSQPDAPLAFVLSRVAASECEILTLATAPEARRGGLARALVRRVAESAVALGANELFLEVAEENAAARALYADLGFAVAGKRPRYYVDRAGTAVDALTLRAALPLKRKSAPEAG